MNRERRSPGRTASRRSAASYGTGFLAKTTRPQTYAIILAGGAGTRLWPLARASRPKPFLPLVQGQSLFRLTY
ncbi:MAG: mannose-1-phosphate guanylyltransferase/mannose-6-phosphate isomerase, partial [Acidobacteria bacterium]